MTLPDLTTSLTENGFESAEQVVDFGVVIPYVRYFLRKRDSSCEYLSLILYEDKFCEAAYELFLIKKATSRLKGTPKQSELIKRGFKSLLGSLHRSFEEVNILAKKTEDQTKEEAKRLFDRILLSEKK